MLYVPSPLTTTCSIYYHHLPLHAPCTIMTYPYLLYVPSPLTINCSMYHHHLPLIALCIITTYHYLPYVPSPITATCSMCHHHLPHTSHCIHHHHNLPLVIILMPPVLLLFNHDTVCLCLRVLRKVMSDYRLERWWPLLTNILEMSLRCAYLTAQLPEYISDCMELISSSILEPSSSVCLCVIWYGGTSVFKHLLPSKQIGWRRKRCLGCDTMVHLSDN